MARNSGRAAAVAAEHDHAAKVPARTRRSGAARPRAVTPAPEPIVEPVAAEPAFHERSLAAEGLAALFRVDAGSGWATGSLPAGANDNEIARFLGEAMGFARQMQAAMGGPNEKTAVQILVADPAAAARQSAIEVAVEASGGTVVTLQPGGSGHLVAMLQHFLAALNSPSGDRARA